MNKVLCFIDSLGAGGAQRQLVGLAMMLHERGYKIKVCYYHSIDFYKDFLDSRGIKNEQIPNASNARKRIWAVHQYFKREQPDWVIAYQETPSLVACMAKLLVGKYRLIVSERNTTQRIGLNEHVRFFLYRWADAIVPNSYAQERFLINRYPWMKTKVATITNFVDLNRFAFVEKEKRVCPLIVVAATIWPSKNAIGLIQATKIMKDKGLKFRIEWYGINEAYHDYLSQCKKLIEAFELDDYITLLPKSKQIQEKYEACDFFCLPSFYEGTPNVICEAMSCGRPILCSDVCDNSIYVKEGENGFLFNPSDTGSIAIAIERAINLKAEEYKNFCFHSRRKAEDLLSGSSFINKYISIIES